MSMLLYLHSYFIPNPDTIFPNDFDDITQVLWFFLRSEGSGKEKHLCCVNV